MELSKCKNVADERHILGHRCRIYELGRILGEGKQIGRGITSAGRSGYVHNYHNEMVWMMIAVRVTTN